MFARMGTQIKMGGKVSKDWGLLMHWKSYAPISTNFKKMLPPVMCVISSLIENQTKTTDMNVRVPKKENSDFLTLLQNTRAAGATFPFDFLHI